MKSNLQKFLFSAFIIMVVTIAPSINAQHPITWSVPAINDTQVIGTTKVFQISFTSNQSFQNAVITVVPAIAPYVTVTPTTFANINPQEVVDVIVYIEIPANMIPQLQEGTIHLKKGTQTLAKPLPVMINMVEGGSIPIASEFLLPSQDRIITNPNSGAEYISNELIVGFKTGYGPYDVSYINQDCEIMAYDSFMDIYQLRCNSNIENIYILLSSDVKVRLVAYNTILEEFSPTYPITPAFDSWDENNPQGNNYHFEMCQFPSAWSYTQGDDNLNIGIIDGGFYPQHEDLQSRIKKTMTSHDWIPISTIGGAPYHGNRVAGIIGANGSNEIGIAGAMWKCGLFLYNPNILIGGNPKMLTNWVTKMLKFALLEDNLKILNLSLGRDYLPSETSLFTSDTSLFGDAIRQVISNGKNDFLLICAAGNGGVNASMTPPGCLSLKYSQIISVAAVDNNFSKIPSSNWGETVTVAAPGMNILSTAVNGYLIDNYSTGTSFAAPIVTGLAGLIWSYNPYLSANGVKALIVTGAQNANHKVGNQYFFVINAYESFKLLTTPPPTDFWQQTSVPPSYFITSLEVNQSGYIFAASSSSAADGGVYISTNNGAGWTQINNGLTSTEIFKIAINNFGHLFAVSNGGGLVYRSTNNGTNWTTVGNNLPVSSVNSISIMPNNDIYIATFPGRIYKSVDNGNNWNLVNSAPQAPDGIRPIVRNSLGHIFAGIGSSGIYRSTDNGSTWVQKNSGMTNPLIFCIGVDSDDDLFVGEGHSGGLFKSTNNGETWTQINFGNLSGFAKNFEAILAHNNQIFAGSYVRGVYRSTDNGDTWTEENTGLFNPGIPNYLIPVYSFAKNSGGYVFVGSYTGGIFRSKTPVFLSKIQNRELSFVPITFKLNQNYPNPFNPTTHIKYDLPKNEYVTLKVFDILGREISELVNERQSAGSYEIEFEGINLPSGIYLYRIQAGTFVETKKMVLMK